MEFIPDTGIDRRIAERLKARREALGFSLEELARRSGVSRAMISRIERGESSPTASLLGRLCNGLDLTLSGLMAAAEARGGALARAADQPVWRDPETGYLRRAVNPPATGSPVEIVDVTFPAGASVSYDWSDQPDIDQHVHLLEGTLRFDLGAETYDLAAGDCLHMRLDRPIRYRNVSGAPCRYLVVLTRLGRGAP